MCHGQLFSGGVGGGGGNVGEKLLSEGIVLEITCPGRKRNKHTGRISETFAKHLLTGRCDSRSLSTL